ncbi:MAG: HPr kinase/phosphorylase, partial [Ruthenibacterium sp.]
MPNFSVALDKVVDQLKLEVVFAPTDLKNIPIITADVNRPGLLIAGYDEFFEPTRIQILGKAEIGYMETLTDEKRRVAIHALFSVKPPAVMITRSLGVFPEMMQYAAEFEVPILRTSESTSSIMSGLISLLSVELAQRITRHGVL